MRTIEGRVRPFGSGTNPSFVRIEYPETPEEIAEVLETRYDGDAVAGLMRDAARKTLIRVQDEIRSDESWDGEEAPDELDEDAWADIQAQVTQMAEGIVLEVGTWPGESKSKKKDALSEARQDPESAERLIEELRQRHGL